ncbi:54S ribosomal protein L4 mitochondrial [Rhodotorula mucilaginosa]|uniref:Large ribosomal subunit protein uL29m n=1 Tax=Rhodotorula mucilaginosa TaxID=5537 RepID=A0A9P6W1C9_RHOMI|nr:54S ribosomal protein L4 mitochondrial [Rhodotorula mucilaginosa]TKA53865.1 hypothetical protein B0A53_03655 [Rhodotorula sp. CCFEE 5036]
MQAVARSSLARAASFAPVASSSSSSISHRSFSTSLLRPARSTAYRPKRIPTFYGQHAAAHPQPDPAQRPSRQETDTSNHPLWRFFHDQQSLEVPDKRKDNSSRSWTAPELRLKSFTELHQLWYILLRERNVLLTQREEARRLRVDLSGYTAVPDKLRLCQKSMARIKQVISERRHAALQAAQILRERGQLAQAEQVEHEAKVAQEAVDQSGR